MVSKNYQLLDTKYGNVLYGSIEINHLLKYIQMAHRKHNFLKQKINGPLLCTNSIYMYMA